MGATACLYSVAAANDIVLVSSRDVRVGDCVAAAKARGAGTVITAKGTFEDVCAISERRRRNGVSYQRRKLLRNEATSRAHTSSDRRADRRRATGRARRSTQSASRLERRITIVSEDYNLPFACKALNGKVTRERESCEQLTSSLA